MTTRADLAVVVPCFNEEDRIARLEAGLRSLLERSGSLRIEAVIVDDGSTDRTTERLEELRERARHWSRPPVQLTLLRQPRNRGKGAALRRGVSQARARWVLTADADMATPLTQVLDWHDAGLLDLRSEDRETLYIASREHPLSVVDDEPRRRFIGRAFNLLIQLVTGLAVKDTQCGFKLYPGALADALFGRLRSDGWSHDVELLCRARDAGVAIRSLPTRWRGVAGSKIEPLRDAPVMGLSLLRIQLATSLDAMLGRGPVPGPHSDRVQPRWERAGLLLWITLLTVAFLTFDHYGIGWDEPFHVRYGRLVHEYYSSLLGPTPHRETLSYRNLYLYGGLFDWMTHVASRLLPGSLYDTRHLVTGLVGILGIVGAWRLARLIAGSRAGLFAALALALMPTYYGHMFHNPKDIPFAVAYVWAVFYLARGLARRRPLPGGDVVKIGLAIGTACAIRVGGVILLAYLGLSVAVLLLVHCYRDRRVDGMEATRLLEACVGVGILAWLVMLVTWPYAFENPVSGPLRALTEFSRFPFDDVTLFGGEMVSTLELPAAYVPTYLAVQLPILTQLLVLAGAVWAGWTLLRRRTGGLGRRAAAVALVALAAIFPLGHAMLSGMVLYDALRHLTFVLPMLAVAAAVTLDRLWDQLPDGRPVAHRLAVGLLCVYAALLAWTMMRLHPYEYIYFNQLVGGVSGAADRFETDYWALAYRQAAEELGARLSPRGSESTSASDGEPYRVHVAGPETSATHFFAEHLTLADSAEGADFAIVSIRYRAQRRYDAPRILTVRRDGVDLAVVYDLRRDG